MSWSSAASVAQLAASLMLILRVLVAADPITTTTITTTTDEPTVFERTTYIMSSTENDSDVYLGNSRMRQTSSSLPRYRDGADARSASYVFCAEAVSRFFRPARHNSLT